MLIKPFLGKSVLSQLEVDFKMEMGAWSLLGNGIMINTCERMRKAGLDQKEKLDFNTVFSATPWVGQDLAFQSCPEMLQYMSFTKHWR